MDYVDTDIRYSTSVNIFRITKILKCFRSEFDQDLILLQKFIGDGIVNIKFINTSIDLNTQGLNSTWVKRRIPSRYPLQRG